ncbi:hypothetical protein H6804_03015 [Candidatus Nomurabacteria bacterium]|uniref:Uncharacterized protein n=1 Tax=candidate division WWE3 bacterium TaxID=2053526 RepID=A0A955IWB9_UNCKA|nr:hypothetical protein [candidate division WWE3 bacterium]MCB9827222.1 hypothetical protein [Candidatus Nomurabacteria bacterium]HXK52524.1 hypothetical protein [bacterium]
MASFIGLGFVVYALSLVNNIFVVVEEKQSVIPLYSAGLAWVQIILILIAIPFYSGIYKVPANFVVQNILLFFSTFSFYIYMHWAVNLDKDLIKTPLKEKGSLAFVLSLLPVVLNTGLLFYPVEAFLKGIFSSTVLLSGLIYIQAHYKNRINSKLLYNYFVLGSIFYIILFIFKP